MRNCLAPVTIDESLTENQLFHSFAAAVVVERRDIMTCADHIREPIVML